MLRLYLDEDSMDSALVHALQARGVDVLTAHEAGMVGRPDADHLAFAAEQQRTLCSYNIADFYQLHSRHMAEGENHFGIILMAQQRFGVGEQMRRLVAIVSTMSEENMKNRVEFLSAWDPIR